MARALPQPDPSAGPGRLLSFVDPGSFLDDWEDLALSEGDLEDLERGLLDRPEAGAVAGGMLTSA